MKRDIDPGGILYWDGSRLQVDETPFDGVGIASNFSNAIFAKGGSVVGFTYTGNGDTWDVNDVVFNPTTTATSSFATYSNIPHWHSWFNDNELVFAPVIHGVDGYISSSSYHTGTNVKGGFGDICKLAGMTAVDVSTTNFDNGEWRLPTNSENQLLVGDAHSYNLIPGTPPRGLFGTGHELPALGLRRTISTEFFVGAGYYWSSLAAATTINIFLYFGGPVIASSTYGSAFGMSVRCVPQ